jgi:Na+-translocating ferredoxin:NAD+ oxidoreductase RnfC subunit
MVSVVVQNVNTLINIVRAIEGKPVISKYVTVTGAVKSPSTFEVPIGISMKELIEKAGGATVNPYRIIVGGPMMGYVGNEEDPVTKTTGGIIVLPAEHPLILKKIRDISRNAKLAQAACIRCTLCTQSCPRNLLGHDISPDRVMKSVAFGLSRDVKSITNAFLCVECGVCTYFACPMELDPMKINREIKMQLSKAGVKNPHKRTELEVNEFREMRKVPVNRLIARLGLTEYDVSAPMKGKIETKKVRIPLKMHIGAPATPLVKVGDIVKEGDVIGRVNEGLGANVHASISGKVTEVSGHIVIEG